MALVQFSKWQGAGNDFILLDDRDGLFPAGNLALVRRLCDRHFGIGSDGLLLIRSPNPSGADYHVEFFNPDGSRSFCGNGARCAFAFWCGLLNDRSPARFSAIDGLHTAQWADGEVEITMQDVAFPERIEKDTDLLDTGSPHLVIWVDDPASVDIIPAAHQHRYGPRFKEAGVNVNFVRWHEGRLEMRTYERGVEGETLSCGTGVTAAAISAMQRGLATGACPVSAPGGEFRAAATQGEDRYSDVRLRGPVAEVFNGRIELGT